MVAKILAGNDQDILLGEEPVEILQLPAIQPAAAIGVYTHRRFQGSLILPTTQSQRFAQQGQPQWFSLRPSIFLHIIVRDCSLNSIAQENDQLEIWIVSLQLLRNLRQEQVDWRRFSPDRSVLAMGEGGQVVRVYFFNGPIARIFGRVEDVILFDGGHAYCGMLRKIVRQCGGAAFLYTDDHESDFWRVLVSHRRAALPAAPLAA